MAFVTTERNAQPPCADHPIYHTSGVPKTMVFGTLLYSAEKLPQELDIFPEALGIYEKYSEKAAPQTLQEI